METYLADLVAAQRSAGCEAHVLAHGQPLPDDPPWLHCLPVQFQLSFAPVAIGFAQALQRLIKLVKPDLLHLHMPNNAVLWALLVPAARRLPWVVHRLADILTDRMPTAVRLLFKVCAVLESSALRRAECIVATSPPYLAGSTTLASLALQMYGGAVGLGTVAPRTSGRTTWCKQSAALAGGLRLLDIGHMTYYKNFGTLVQAVPTHGALSTGIPLG